MLSSLTLPIINGTSVFSALQSSSYSFRSPAVSKWELQREQNVRLFTRRSLAIRVLANPNVSPDERNSRKEVVMVDPLEAKRLAAKQMAQIKAREKRKKRRQIEAINGAWAMIGLTAGLVIEGETGNSIIATSVYFSGATSLVKKITASTFLYVTGSSLPCIPWQMI